MPFRYNATSSVSEYAGNEIGEFGMDEARLVADHNIPQ